MRRPVSVPTTSRRPRPTPGPVCALGMLVQVREGSSAQNLDAVLPLLVAGELEDAWCLVTDDIFPNDLRRVGHIDGLLRRVVAAGVPPATAVRHASFVPARHYGLVDRGAIAPGYRADLVLVNDLKNFHVNAVIKNGKVAARDGRCLDHGAAPRIEVENTIHLPPLDERAFCLALSEEECPVIEIVPDQIVTRHTLRSVRSAHGQWAFDPERDVVLIASIERHRASGRIGLGLVGGFGFTRHGALGSSVAHDSHNLVIAGTNPGDMLVCARRLRKRGAVSSRRRKAACVRYSLCPSPACSRPRAPTRSATSSKPSIGLRSRWDAR